MRRSDLIEPTSLREPPYEAVPPAVEKHLRDARPSAESEAEPSFELVCQAWLMLSPEVGVCSTNQGAYLVELHEHAVVRAYRISPLAHVAFEAGPLLSRLEIGETCISVRSRVAHAALQLLGIARLGGTPPTLSGGSRWLVANTEWETALLSTNLEPGEFPLAFIPLHLFVSVPSPWLGETKARIYLMFSDSRIKLVAASIAGDQYTLGGAAPGEVVPVDHLRVLDEGRVQANQHAWKDKNAALLAQVVQCARKTGPERILEVVRCLYTPHIALKGRKAHAATHDAFNTNWVLHALEHINASSGATQTSRCIEMCVRRQPQGTATQTPLWRGGLVAPWKTEACETSIAEVWERFGFELSVGRWLLDELEQQPAWYAAAIELSDAVWRRRLSQTLALPSRAEADLDHAEYCMRLGAPERVAPLLVETRQLLPPLQLGDLTLPSFVPPSPLRQVRKRLERAMIQLREGNPKSQTAARQRLVVLDPLNPEVLDEAVLCPPPVSERAKLAAALLRGPFASSPAQPAAAPTQVVRTLDDARIEDQLRHPLSHDKPGLLDRFKSAVAQVRTPDFATLKLYCERVIQADSPLLTVVDEAATLLGLGHIDVYISRGHDDVGIRAFRERNIILLLGGQHVETDSRHWLDPTELRFFVASELGHVRFGHRRVSPQDVLRGAIQKGKQGVDLALSVLPVLGGLRLTNRLGMITAKLSLPQIDKAMRTARSLSQAVDSAIPQKAAHMDMSQANEDLLEAHRLAQLSADRAGLLCCGDLPAAVLALLKGRTDYVRVASSVAELGLLKALHQQEASNESAYADLRLRVGSLISFYLSDEYEQLRRLAYPPLAGRSEDRA